MLDMTAVQLKLFLAGALIGQASAAAALAGEADAHAGKAREHVFEPGRFDLQPGFPGPGPAGEDLQNDAGAVEHLRVPFLFQVADLHGGEGFVEDDNIRVRLLDHQLDLVHLSGADQRALSDLRRGLNTQAGDRKATGAGQFLELQHLPVVSFAGHGTARFVALARHKKTREKGLLLVVRIAQIDHLTHS